MRALFLIVFSIINIYLNAQVINDSIRINSYEYEVPKVCGIEFGSSYDYVKKKLEDRYGNDEVDEYKGSLFVNGGKVGNFYFNILMFNFQTDNKNTYFYYSRFLKYFSIDDLDSACSVKDMLGNDVRSKYQDMFEEYTNDSGFKCYRFGVNPLNENNALGLVTLYKEKDRDGNNRICLELSYGPIYYIDKSYDF